MCSMLFIVVCLRLFLLFCLVETISISKASFVAIVVPSLPGFVLRCTVTAVALAGKAGQDQETSKEAKKCKEAGKAGRPEKQRSRNSRNSGKSGKAEKQERKAKKQEKQESRGKTTSKAAKKQEKQKKQRSKEAENRRKPESKIPKTCPKNPKLNLQRKMATVCLLLCLLLRFSFSLRHFASCDDHCLLIRRKWGCGLLNFLWLQHPSNRFMKPLT